MYVGIRAHDLPERDIVSLSEKLAEMDIREIQLALPKSIEGIDFYTGGFTPMLARGIKKELQRNDISIAVLGCYISPSLEDERARQGEIDIFTEGLKYAKYLDADMVGTETPGCSSEKFKSEEAYAITVDSIKKMVSAAEKLGVRIGLEGVFCNPIYSPERMDRLLKEVDSPNLAVIFDPVNLITAENYKEQRQLIDKAFSLYGGKIEAIHLKDFNITDGKKVEVKTFDGIFDYKYLIEKIKAEKPYLPILIEGENQEAFPNIREKLMSV